MVCYSIALALELLRKADIGIIVPFINIKNIFKEIQINHGHLGLHTNDWGICEEERNMTVAVGPVNTLIHPRRSLFNFSGGLGKI